MPQESSFFNGIPYSAVDFAKRFSALLNDGAFAASGVLATELKVTADNATLLSSIAIGQAQIQGYFYNLYGSAHTLTHDAGDSVYGRYDRVVLEVNIASGLVNLKIVKGTPAASPVAPTLTQDLTGVGIYQISLAKILVPQNATLLLNANVTDERSTAGLKGMLTALASGTSVTQTGFTELSGANLQTLLDNLDDYLVTNIPSATAEDTITSGQKVEVFYDLATSSEKVRVPRVLTQKDFGKFIENSSGSNAINSIAGCLVNTNKIAIVWSSASTQFISVKVGTFKNNLEDIEWGATATSNATAATITEVKICENGTDAFVVAAFTSASGGIDMWKGTCIGNNTASLSAKTAVGADAPTSLDIAKINTNIIGAALRPNAGNTILRTIDVSGTPTVVAGTALWAGGSTGLRIKVIPMSTTNTVVAANDSSDYPNLVGFTHTTGGATLVAGTPLVLKSIAAKQLFEACKTNGASITTYYKNDATSYQEYARVVSVSGSTLSPGTEATIETTSYANASVDVSVGQLMCANSNIDNVTMFGFASNPGLHPQVGTPTRNIKVSGTSIDTSNILCYNAQTGTSPIVKTKRGYIKLSDDIICSVYSQGPLAGGQGTVVWGIIKPNKCAIAKSSGAASTVIKYKQVNYVD